MIYFLLLTTPHFCDMIVVSSTSRNFDRSREPNATTTEYHETPRFAIVTFVLFTSFLRDTTKGEIMYYSIEQFNESDGFRHVIQNIESKLEILFPSSEKGFLNATVRNCEKSYSFTSDHLLGDLFEQRIVLYDAYFNDDFSFKDDKAAFDELMISPSKMRAQFYDGAIKRSYDELCDVFKDSFRFLVCKWSDLTAKDVFLFRLLEDCLNYHEEKQIRITRSFMDAMIKDHKIDIPTPFFSKGKSWYESINNWKRGNEFFELYQKRGNEITYDCYECYSLSDMALIIIYELSKNGVLVRKCDHCKKWFVPTNAKEKYCSRITDGKTCKEAAKAQKRKERGQTDLQKKYNSVRTGIANRKNKKNLSIEEEKAIDKLIIELSDGYRERNAKLKRGEITQSDIISWLDSYTKKGGRTNGIL